MQLPVVVVVVAESGSGDGRRQRGGGSHRPGVKSAVVGGAAVERVPVEAGEDDGSGARGQQHRVLAARSGRQNIVDAEHAHRHAPNRAGAGQRDRPGGGREGGKGGRESGGGAGGAGGRREGVGGAGVGGGKGWRDTKSKLFGEILKRDRSEKSGAFSEGSLRAECACVSARVHVCVCV